MIKIAIAAFVALFCIFYALQNIVNLQAGHGFVALMASMADHVGYPRHFGPAVTSSTLVWLMLAIIIAGELLAGTLAARGAFDMWRSRNSDADTFNGAKTYAIAACGVAILVWYGVFQAIGGAYFQMWQTEAGQGPFTHSAMFGIQHAALWVVLGLKDD